MTTEIGRTTARILIEIEAVHLRPDQPFTLTEGEQVSRGQSFRSDSDFRTWEVTGGETEGPLGEQGIAF